MKEITCLVFYVTICSSFIFSCNNERTVKPSEPIKDPSLVNKKHLDYLYTPVTFNNGAPAAGIYIYAEAPDYHLVTDSDEGFTCVDDVARAALVYLRNENFLTDTSAQKKTKNLIHFILEMQAPNGYFYNFLFPDNSINKEGVTSSATPNWWSWRALQTLTEAAPLIKKTDADLAKKMHASVDKLVQNIKEELADLPKTTRQVSGITVPQWLPAGSATDQAAILILGLLNYTSQNDDKIVKACIRKLADGIVMMQQGDASNFPYSAFMSWENIWHAYGCDQAYALLKAGTFLKDSVYTKKALPEVNNFYPWLLKNGMRSSFSLIKKENKFLPVDEKEFEQIAYGLRPMIFAATEAYEITGDQKYADIAGELTAWFFGKNSAGAMMYNKETGRCFDGIIAANKINKNSGAESTIEALLSFQKIEKHPAIITALKKYKNK